SNESVEEMGSDSNVAPPLRRHHGGGPEGPSGRRAREVWRQRLSQEKWHDGRALVRDRARGGRSGLCSPPERRARGTGRELRRRDAGGRAAFVARGAQWRRPVAG